MVILTVNASYSDPHNFILRSTVSVGLKDQHLSGSTKPGFEKGLMCFSSKQHCRFLFSAITKTLLTFVYYPLRHAETTHGSSIFCLNRFYPLLLSKII
jgi:hypothetical protein